LPPRQVAGIAAFGGNAWGAISRAAFVASLCFASSEKAFGLGVGHLFQLGEQGLLVAIFVRACRSESCGKQRGKLTNCGVIK
jgi:hypothetical protein